MSRVKSPPAWLVEGAMVDYHSVIGGPITQFNMRVRVGPQQLPSEAWVVWLDGKAGCVFVDACTPATGSLGPSNDDSPAVEVEMRAAELDLWHTVDGIEEFDLEMGEMTAGEYNGWQKHISPEWLVVWDEQSAGWLGRELASHEARDQRDATAWAWDISRPLAEQLAETAADDAAAHGRCAVITIKTDLLLAVSRWALDDHQTRPHLCVVLFKGKEMVACDGHRLVRVPVACAGLVIALDRDHIAAAAAAQKFCRATSPSDDLYGGDAVEISVDGKQATINVGRFAVSGPLCDPSTFPPVDQVMPKDRPATSPDGYGFNVKYLAAIHEVEVAAGARYGSHGVKITGWSADAQGAMLFEGYNGIRYVIMPVRV